MSRRVSLPGAAELFRVTGEDPDAAGAAVPAADPAPSAASSELEPLGVPLVRAEADEPTAPWREQAPSSRPSRRPTRDAERRPTGRERHDEKITVYCSPEELVDLERARLALRADHGLGIDRGRIVREAIAVVLADLEAKGENSILVRRLRGVR